MIPTLVRQEEPPLVVRKVASGMALDAKLLGARLAGMRADAGWTQEELAAELARRWPGDGRAPGEATIARYEKGETKISLDTFVSIAIVCQTHGPCRRFMPSIVGADDRSLWRMLLEED